MMRRLLKRDIVFVFFNASVILASVYLAIVSSSRGAGLLYLEKKRLALEERKQILTDELVAKTSLEEVSNRADELDMQKPERIIYLNGGESVAENSVKNF